MEITKSVTVTIDRGELLRLFARAILPDAEASEGRERTLWKALGHLVGITDVEAVRIANKECGSSAHSLSQSPLVSSGNGSLVYSQSLQMMSLTKEVIKRSAYAYNVLPMPRTINQVERR